MIRQWLNGKILLLLIAIIIVVATVFYSTYLAHKIAHDEKLRVETWVQAQTTIINTTDQSALNLAVKIAGENKDIPIIETNEKDIPTGNYVNIDTQKVKHNATYILRKLRTFKREHKPIVVVVSNQPYIANKYYYGQSILQDEVRYYPLVQLIIVALFIIITIMAVRASYISTQNRVWAGMAKETAHQLGTPVSSLKGWIEVLKDMPANEKIIPEISKDVARLELVTDRFGKIGSKPHVEESDVMEHINYMVDYIKKRAGAKVEFIVESDQQQINAMISSTLFDWVIENLLKNALDAMEGKGRIIIHLEQQQNQLFIDITDTGKGITKTNIQKVFNAGFTTKKRGWGLGLTLTKRIIKEYHKGDIYVKWSEVGKGTTFRIELPWR
jgi:signal transduction histidine kinase